MHQPTLISSRITGQGFKSRIKNLNISTPTWRPLRRNAIQQRRCLSSTSFFQGRSSRTSKSSATALLSVGFAGWVSWATDSDSNKIREPDKEERMLLSLDKCQDHNLNSTEVNDNLRPDSLFSYPALLKGNKTRLLVLEPGSFQDELKCHLMFVTTNLEDYHYQALSYVWGSTQATITESSSGKKIKITQNLEAALRRIRDGVRPRLLWADAICIDQSNKDERSSQVEIMREIYTSAQRVIVWLGEELKQDSLAFNSLNQLNSRLESRGDLRSLVRLGWSRDEKSGRLVSGGADKSFLSEIKYDHLVNLLRRDWFRRTWVIQEVASAQHAVVICGQEHMRWETFAEVFMTLGEHFLSLNPFGGEDAQHSLENISAIENARRSRSGPLFMSLFHILVATSFSQCTEPQDKIYAVKGLAKDWTDQRGLETDYRISAETLFKKFAIADSNRNMNLRVLSCASSPSSSSNNPSLPSWVPDWRNIENPHPFVRYSDRTKFCASGGMAAEAWHSHHESVLHVKGKRVDFIAKLGSMPIFAKTVAVFELNSTKVEQFRQSAKWLKECQELASDGKGGALTSQRWDQLWRTLTCDLTGDGFPAPKRYSEYFARYMEFLESAPEKFNNYLTESQTSDPRAQGFKVVPGGYENHSIIERSIDRWSSKRRFCTTTGGSLACVPKASREGDLICVLFGGDVPYILRPTGTGFYWVIGECYVQGIMYGEGLSHDTGVKEFQLI